MKPVAVVALPRRWINVVFAAIVLSFVAATALVHFELRAVDRGALVISTNTAPSIERLADARAELRHLQVVLDGAADAIQHDRPMDPRAIHEAQRALDDRVDAYLSLPVLPDEHDAWTRVLVARAHVDESISHFVADATQGDREAAVITLRQRISGAVAELYEALTNSIRGSAGNTLDFANEIRTFREQATLLAIVLQFVCASIAVGGALLVRRVVRGHAALLERQRRLDEARASELEAFAGRVAHDILGPLGTVSFALELSDARGSEEQRAKLKERGLAALERVKKLVSGLLDFARAGGRPDLDARANVRETIGDILSALEPVARDARAELTTTTTTDAAVVCNPGVLTSLVSNLARNALKYLGDSRVRRVEIRAHERSRSVRVEVADTGPGVPRDLEAHLFEPYVRAKGAREPGIGLGLATVKRLAEGHGGSVGVESKPGGGTTFWFELPKAPSEVAAVC